jgi:polar amino acid transport system permease protein
MNFDWSFFWEHLFTPGPAFLDGLWRTIYISVVSMVLALLVGLLIALMRLGKVRVLRWVASIYVWVIRGTPLLVQLVLIYLGLAAMGIYTFKDQVLFGINFQGVVQAAIVTLVIHESAYIAEIIRAAILSIDKGQMEASISLGMTPRAGMGWIILPQALRVMVPPLGNTFNGLMKSTSVLSIIGVSDMFLVSQSISSTTFKTFEIFIVVALYYLALTTIWTWIQAWIEGLLDRQIGIVRPAPRRGIFPTRTNPIRRADQLVLSGDTQ